MASVVLSGSMGTQYSKGPVSHDSKEKAPDMPVWLLPMVTGRVLAQKFSPLSLQVKAISDAHDPQYFTNEACIFSSEDSIPPLLHPVEVYTTPEVSPHDSPARSSQRLSQAKLSFKTVFHHTCRRGEPCGWKAQPGEFSSVAGSPAAQKVQPHLPLRANDQVRPPPGLLCYDWSSGYLLRHPGLPSGCRWVAP